MSMGGSGSKLQRASTLVVCERPKRRHSVPRLPHSRRVRKGNNLYYIVPSFCHVSARCRWSLDTTPVTHPPAAPLPFLATGLRSILRLGQVT